jgi:hypothetical protein
MKSLLPLLAVRLDEVSESIPTRPLPRDRARSKASATSSQPDNPCQSGISTPALHCCERPNLWQRVEGPDGMSHPAPAARPPAWHRPFPHPRTIGLPPQTPIRPSACAACPRRRRHGGGVQHATWTAYCRPLRARPLLYGWLRGKNAPPAPRRTSAVSRVNVGRGSPQRVGSDRHTSRV